MPDDTPYTIADLARLTSLNVRTIRYYIAQGLIPASGESGPGAHYGQGHLDRLRLTKRLQQQHLPLAEIRQRLAALSDHEVADLLQAPAEPGSSETSALDYVRGILGSTGRSGPGSPVPPSLPAAPPLASRAAIVASAMPRMKDVPAPDPRLAAARAPAIREAGVAAPRPTDPQSLERSQWERHSLGPNIELHVRRPLGRLEQRRVERLITIARQVLKEDGV